MPSLTPIPREETLVRKIIETKYQVQERSDTRGVELFTPSRFCDKRCKPHARHTVFPRSDKPDSHIGTCAVCHKAHEYDKVSFEGVFAVSLASNPATEAMWV